MDFTVGSALNFGWETFKQRPWFFIGASVVIVIAYLVVGGVSTGINAALGGSSEEPTLIGSAVNFGLSTLVGMGAIAFYLAAHDNPDTVELSVSDTGPGIDPEILPRIFDFLFTTKLEGTGIGLALCKRIVAAHGWKIEYRPRPDGGAVFRLSSDSR